MNTQTKIMIGLLAIFIAGITMGVGFAKYDDIATFKSSSGYEWTIKGDTWENMKKQANEQYHNMRNLGSITPGYSDSVDVTVTKGGNTYHGIAYAIENDQTIRCEVRKALPGGERLTANETPKGT